jgi:hypothetical protein
MSDCWQKAYAFIVNGETGKAIDTCEKEPCSASLECQRFLGWKYYEQNQMEKALSWFFKAVEQGDADALFGIGSIYFTQRNFQTALQYYEHAGELGYARAYGWIGYIYQLGLGVPRSIEMATGYYKKAAAHGYLLAERALIHIVFQHGSVLRKILVLPKYFYLLIKAAALAYRDVNDKRLMDIPNAFKKIHKE